MPNKILFLNVDDWKYVLLDTNLYMKFKKIADEITYDPFIPSGTALLKDGKNITKVVMKEKWN